MTESDTDFLNDLFRPEGGAVHDQRQFDRREIDVPVELIPMTPRGLRYEASMKAQTQNISSGGVALIVSQPPLEARWAVRFDLRERYALLEVVLRRAERTEDGQFLLSCEFVRRLDKPRGKG